MYNLKCFFLRSIIALCLPIFIFTGCALTGSDSGKASTSAPIACLDQVVQVKYKTWQEGNVAEIENLKKLSTMKEWMLLVACDRNVKKINLRNSECETIYSSKNRIKYAGIQADGRIALIEYQKAFAQKDRKHFVVVLQKNIEILRLKLKKNSLLGIYLGGNPILVEDNFIIYPDGNSAMLFEIRSGGTRILYEGQEGSSLLTAIKAGNSCFLVMTDSTRNPENSIMVVLDSHFQVNRQISHVTNAMMCDEKILIEQNNRILKFDPVKNTSKPLTNGTLLAVLNHDSFLYTDSAWRIKDDGWLRLDYSLNEYNIVNQKSRHIAGNFSIDTCYGVEYPLISPDNEYVIIPDNTDSALLDCEYLVYELFTGKKVCAFYEPFNGKYYFTHLLAWSDNSNEESLSSSDTLSTQ